MGICLFTIGSNILILSRIRMIFRAEGSNVGRAGDKAFIRGYTEDA